jgi:hypothetical protein
MVPREEGLHASWPRLLASVLHLLHELLPLFHVGCLLLADSASLYRWCCWCGTIASGLRHSAVVDCAHSS